MDRNNIVWHHATVTRLRRRALLGHRSFVLWFTGLSGSGKSTLAHAVEEQLHRTGHLTTVLDGDNVRHGLCSDLSFSGEDRTENIRRIGEVTKLFIEAGAIVLTAFISPLRQDRDRVRLMHRQDEFIEIYCRCPIDICEERDVKGLYKKARRGEIPEFTGISAPYEEPGSPDLIIDSDKSDIDAATNLVIALIRQRGLLSPAIDREIP